jgi:hypothetical protein
LKTLPANESRGHKPSLISSLYKWLSGREAASGLVLGLTKGVRD